MKFLVLQHASHEGPGRYAQFAKEAGIQLETIELWKPGYVMPSELEYRRYKAALIMGGPQGVNDLIEKYPSKDDEIRFIQNFPKPILGTCLGSQLIAYAYDGRVYAGKKECGFYPVELTRKGKQGIFKGFNHTFPVFHWHGDAFEAPVDTELVLSKGEHPVVQAFAYQNRFGVLFHMEMTPDMIRTLIKEDSEWFEKRDKRYHGNTENSILERAASLEKQMNRQARDLFYNFVSVVQS